ncbi:hypothetical protein OESDEN_00650 [Oesophagostomum dentatum]|uniref:Uncharacterized protein n=1 Tax=Oesophagostomum dentatum TaxID=61180 RepID=A0A0B1TT95_OESDE|nr:hypothetical protein OESDEN_00650 [Oesophagostomum dentatum]
MPDWIKVLSISVLLALAVQQPVDAAPQNDRFPASGPVGFISYQKKWSRLEPSIRFFKRTALPQYQSEE